MDDVLEAEHQEVQRKPLETRNQEVLTWNELGSTGSQRSALQHLIRVVRNESPPEANHTPFRILLGRLTLTHIPHATPSWSQTGLAFTRINRTTDNLPCSASVIAMRL